MATNYVACRPSLHTPSLYGHYQIHSHCLSDTIALPESGPNRGLSKTCSGLIITYRFRNVNFFFWDPTNWRVGWDGWDGLGGGGYYPF